MRQRSLAKWTRRRKLMSSGRVENQYLVGFFSPFGHSIKSHSDARGLLSLKSRPAGRTRKQAKREDRGAATPSRHSIVRHARLGKESASFSTATGLCSGSRRKSVGGRPRPDQGLGGSGSPPSGHTVVLERMPAT